MEIIFNPVLQLYPSLLQYADSVLQKISNSSKNTFVQNIVALRQELEKSKRKLLSSEDIKLIISKSLILDFLAQGWTMKIKDNTIILNYADETLLQNEIKEKVRRGHLIQRDSQLSKHSVREFIKKMEKKKLTPKGWFSIFSLMRDGKSLSKKLKSSRKFPKVEKRVENLADIIKPYLQFVEQGENCKITGLPLMDIWRYFRHTWVTPYKVLPGRSIYILIRDAATPNHCVIGIAALGSAVAQHSVRDKWIGWDSATFYKHLLESPKLSTIKHLGNTLNQMINLIYIKDLKKLGITKKDFRNPSEKLIKRLKRFSVAEIKKHRLNPNKRTFNDVKIKASSKKINWATFAETHLFKSKRYKLLASLLNVKRVLLNHRIFEIKKVSELKNVLEIAEVQNTIQQLVRRIKGEKVGINIMDIVICGSIAPYNSILGGKLVCMLLTSPEVSKYYKTKYTDRQSIIASSMRGKPIKKEQDLIYLGTTSLYGVGSSQYNRIKIPSEEIGGERGAFIEYKNLGLSAGYGSFHFSQTTLDYMKLLLARNQNGKRVNSIFGEGANPLMRKIRECLDTLNLPSEKILNHGFKRVVYGVPLSINFREVLLGFKKIPSYIIPQTKVKDKTQLLAQYWIKRWLSRRIENDSILEEMSKHSLIYPINHGARVRLIKDDEEANLF